MFSIYIHIPYCASKCRYCDFYSRGRSNSVPFEYISALLRELGAFYSAHGNIAADTVYLGGGTPSLLSVSQVQQILSSIKIAQNAEITIEANPDTVTLDTLRGYYASGCNRISFGVQSASDTQLLTLGRTHTAQQAYNALHLAHTAGFNNISGDIILALPSYTYKELNDTIALLHSSGFTHISSYLLKIEPNTVFGKSPPPNLPTEDEAANFYLYAVDALAKYGYAQYEISNFAKNGFESRHNTAYWLGSDYLGLGAAAHSCVDNKRFYYSANIQAFISGTAPIQDGEYTSADYIMLHLRLTSGLNLTELKEKYGIIWGKEKQEFIAKLAANNMAVFNDNILRLTPQGMLIQNSILCELI